MTAIPQLWPPSSDRNHQTPEAQTRLPSFGSTAITLLYQPMFVKVFTAWGELLLHSRTVAPRGLVRISVWSLLASVFLTRASQEPASPPRSDRYTASNPLR